MAVTAIRIYGNDNVPNTLTTANTVPAAKTWTITYITVANKTASPVTLTITVGGITILPTISIGSNAFVTIDNLKIVANATETVQVRAGTASAVALTINGVEVG